MSKDQQKPVAYWMPKADQFCKADPIGRAFAKSWEPLYAAPPETAVLQAKCDAYLANVILLDAEVEALTKERDDLQDRITELTSEEHSIPELRNQLQEAYEEKRKCYFAVSQQAKTIKNLIKENNELKEAAKLAWDALQRLYKDLPYSNQINGGMQAEDALTELKKVLKD